MASGLGLGAQGWWLGLCLLLHTISFLLLLLILFEGGGLLGQDFGHFFMISGYFMIVFVVSFQENERITGLSVFLSVKTTFSQSTKATKGKR